MAVDTTRRVKIEFSAEDQGVGEQISAFKGQLIAVAAVAAAAGKAIDFVGDETARLDKIAKGAQQTGLGFDQYQRLAQVSKLAGTNIDTLAKGTIRLTRNLNDLAAGRGKKVADNLGLINLELEDLQDKDPTEQLAILADAFAEVDSDSQRTAIAIELFGRAGADLIPLLNSGSEAINELSADVGKVFSREDLAAAEAYQDALANLDKATSDLAGELAIAVAPALTEVADELRESGPAIAEVIPVVARVATQVVKAIEPIVAVVGFFADQLGAAGRVIERVFDALGDLGDGALEAAEDIGDFLADSVVADWAEEATGAVDGLIDGAGDLATEIREQIPLADELAQSWEDVSRSITGADVAASEFGAIEDIKGALGDVLDVGRELAAQQEQAKESAEDQIGALTEQADQQKFLSDLTAAEGGSQREINARLIQSLQLRRDAAALQAELTKSTEDEAKLLSAERALELAQARARTAGRGRGPTEAERIRAAGAARVATLEQEAKLAALIADSTGERVELERLQRDAAQARIDLERQALEATRARGEVAKLQLEERLAALEREEQILDLQARIQAREAEAALISEAVELETARFAARAEAEGRVISLEQVRAQREIERLEAEGQFAAAAQRRIDLVRQEAEAQELLFQIRQAELEANPPETELERIEQRDALAQLAFDRDLARLTEQIEVERLLDAERARLAEADAARMRDRQKLVGKTVQTTNQFLSQGQAFASTIIGAAIKDEDKRAKAELKARGISAIATGVLETVQAAASFASFNFVQGALHTAAAALAFTQGGIMLAGNLPGNRSAGGAGAGAGAGAAQQREQRETTEGPTIPESVPAADQTPRPGTTGREQRPRENLVIIERIDVTGAIDDDTVEKIGIGLNNAGFGLEGVGS